MKFQLNFLRQNQNQFNIYQQSNIKIKYKYILLHTALSVRDWNFCDIVNLEPLILISNVGTFKSED